MHSYIFKKGTTNVSIELEIIDSTDGTPETGVLWNTAGIALEYRRGGAVSTAITEATLAALTTAHTDGGFLHIGNGVYRFDLPDAALASGVDKVIVHGTVTGMVVIPLTIQLVDYDPFDATRLGLTALPNAAADGAGGLAISDAGGLDLDTKLANTNEITAARMGALTDWLNGGRLDLLLDAIKVPTDKMVFTVANQLDSNLLAVSGGTSAAVNLELMFDGTGYIDPTAPASRSQVDAIASSTGGALNFEILADNTGGAIKGVTFVGSQTGTFANTEAEDGSYHVIDDTGNAIDIVYRANISGGRLGSQLIFKGYLNSNNDTINVQVYDFVGADWETRLVITGQNGSINIALDIPILLKHTGTGADLGDVLVRFVNTGQSGPQLNIDELLVQGVANTSSLGFLNAAVWMDTIDGESGTAEGVGQATKPSDNIADGLTIAAANNLHRFEVGTGSTITLGSATNFLAFAGVGWVLALGGQDVGSSRFFGAAVSGTGIGSGRVVLDRCLFIGAASFTNFALLSCNLTTQMLTLGVAGTHRLINCEGSAATIDFDAALGATTLDVFRWSGSLTIDNMKAGDVLNFNCNEGALTLNASCTAGTINKSGTFGLTDNSTGMTSNDVGQAALLAVSTEARLAELDAVNLPTDIAAINTKLGSPTVTDMSTDIANMQTDVDTTNTKLGTPTDTDMSTDIANIQADVDTTNTSIGLLNDISLAGVNGEILDVMATDTIAESSGVPSAVASAFAKISYIYDSVANKSTETGTTRTLRNRADSVTISTATLSDDTVTFVKGTDT